jgi:hypothetical protein
VRWMSRSRLCGNCVWRRRLSRTEMRAMGVLLHQCESQSAACVW